MAQTARDYLRDDVRRLADRVELLQSHGPPDTQANADFGSTVDPIYKEFGSSAPLPLRGESSRGYQLRVLSELQHQIPGHRPIPLSALAAAPDSAFVQQRDVIVASARAAAERYAPPGTLRERRVNHGGVPVTEFTGDSFTCWAPFLRPATAVARFRNGSGQTIRINRTTVR